VNQLLRGDHGRHGTLKSKSKSKVAKLEGAPFKRGICLRVRAMQRVPVDAH